MNGYFVQHGGNCVVTLMVLESSDADALLPATPTRVRLLLYPGQVAGLDSEEGRSLNFTCGDRAARLFVDIGGTNALIALQELSLEKVAAQAR